MKYFFLFLFWLLHCNIIEAQSIRFKACVIAFYNLENLYDTINNPTVNDDDFTPLGIKKYTATIYLDKLDKLATVLKQMGTDMSPDGPAIIGVAEIENDTVLQDLTHHPYLVHRKYQIIHYNSRDARGIDVALLYNPHIFLPEKAEKLFVALPGNSKESFFTRDILYVKGWLAGEPVHVYVNHWPSRLGGEKRSAPARAVAAGTCKKHMDSILQKEPAAKIIVMGDLNDDPDSPSITESLGAKASAAQTRAGELFNPWVQLYSKGIGTLANRDSWGLFDQIILSHAWLNPSSHGFFYHRPYIFSPNFLKENTGRYKGYPMRTWDGNTYRGGYSDHFPTYVVLLKNIK